MLFTRVKAPQTTNVLLWLCPFQIESIKSSFSLLHFLLCCLFYCHVLHKKKKKSRVIKFWGFFMYLLFLGIVRKNYTVKLDDALTGVGKLCFRETFLRARCAFPSFLPRAFHWNGITGHQNSLQRAKKWNSKLELFHSLFVYRAKSWCTV